MRLHSSRTGPRCRRVGGIHLAPAIRSLQSMLYLDPVVLEIRVGKDAACRADFFDQRIRDWALALIQKKAQRRRLQCTL